MYINIKKNPPDFVVFQMNHANKRVFNPSSPHSGHYVHAFCPDWGSVSVPTADNSLGHAYD